MSERAPVPSSNGSIADRVIERAQNRRRPLMENDETVIRVIVDHFIDTLVKRGEWPPREGEDDLVDCLVAMVGGMEFEFGKDGGFTLKMVKPDEGMFPDA